MTVIEIKNEDAQQAPASGCGGCAVKSSGNCTSHLTPVVGVIVREFVQAEVLFDPADPDHVEAVGAILKEDMRDDKGNHIPYEVPSDPKLQEWFLGLIRQKVAAGLNSSAPAQ